MTMMGAATTLGALAAAAVVRRSRNR
jgi:MYXO-CTERM domain-containing protein